MKIKNVLFLTCTALIAVAAIAIAAEEAEKTATPAQTQQRLQRPMPGRGPVAAPGERGRGMADPNAPAAGNREDILREAMARRMEVHRQEIAKIEAIVKIAEEEKATKTVEALKALIAEKDKEVKDQVEQAERRRMEMQQRLQERLSERGTPPAGARQGQGQGQGQGGEQRTRGQQRQPAN